MATFSTYIKNIFWVLLLLQVAPLLIKNIKEQYTDLTETKTKVGVITVKGAVYEAGSLVKNIKKFFENDEIKAILLKMEITQAEALAAAKRYLMKSNIIKMSIHINMWWHLSKT